MTTINFFKYTGAGNDFVVLDNRDEWFDWENYALIEKLCDRKFGVGADGILLLQNKEGYAFEMLYANRDGSRGSMCGNGGRCITAFAHNLGIIQRDEKILFLGPDGDHEAVVIAPDRVQLRMKEDVVVIEQDGLLFVDTGAPHYIQHVVELDQFPVVSEAQKFRDRVSDPKGVNVNYVEKLADGWHVRTYERGVEDETLACGTGATAVTLTLSREGKISENSCVIHMPGGTLSVSFENEGESFKNIWLEGPAEFVFEGVLKY